MLIKVLFAAQSRSGKAARLQVFIFHRVLPVPDPLFPDEMHAARFDTMCKWLKNWFNVLPLSQAIDLLKAGNLPSRAACITFDDGYADNHSEALPILKKHGLTATFFIATGFLDGGRMWNDTLIEAVRFSKLVFLDLSALKLGCYSIATVEEKKAVIHDLIKKIKYLSVAERVHLVDKIAFIAQVEPSNNLMMTSQEVINMKLAGMHIGAHTVSHPILAKLSSSQAASEIGSSRDVLEKLLGERIGLFAYPNGKPFEDYSEDSVEIVKDLGFDAAVSTQWGTAGYGDDIYQIRRFTPWDQSKIRFAARLSLNMRNRELNLLNC
jgi:peptidoglycan/xylan/chitin deacetylase (PgdA/CDA1 family)